MTYERDEYRQVLAEQQAKVAANGAQRDHLVLLSQAAVNASNMTGSTEWDVFLQFLQSHADRVKASRVALDEVLKDPRVTSDEDMRRAKIQYIEADAIVRTLEAVISLPSDIIESGDKARDLLARMGSDQTVEGTA